MKFAIRDDAGQAGEYIHATPTPSISEVTLAIEFLTMGLRSLVDGHPADSHMVREPLMFAYSKVRDMTSGYAGKLA